MRLLPLLLLASLAAATNWRYYPINSIQNGLTSSGIYIHIEPAGAFVASAVTQNGDAEPISTTQEMSSDPGRDLLPLRIDNLDRFRVLRLTITVGGRTLTYENPKAGKLYEASGE